MYIIDKIINLIAKDSAVDKVRRIVKLNKDVAGFPERNSESISGYIELFGALENRYMNLIRVGPTMPKANTSQSYC